MIQAQTGPSPPHFQQPLAHALPLSMSRPLRLDTSRAGLLCCRPGLCQCSPFRDGNHGPSPVPDLHVGWKPNLSNACCSLIPVYPHGLGLAHICPVLLQRPRRWPSNLAHSNPGSLLHSYLLTQTIDGPLVACERHQNPWTASKACHDQTSTISSPCPLTPLTAHPHQPACPYTRLPMATTPYPLLP